MPRRLYVWCRRPGTSQAKTPSSASSNTALPRAPPSPPPRARKLKTVPLWDQFVTAKSVGTAFCKGVFSLALEFVQRSALLVESRGLGLPSSDV
ncbi:hypothetical protein MTO96_006214 [Rhipicephalus appendiculatus]